MSKSQCIHIIGGGLQGCLTAWQIKKAKPSCQVILLEAADHLMSAFDSISIDGVELNNGFHGVEIPRAGDLVAFFQRELAIEFVITPNDRLLSIEGQLVAFDSPLDEYPTGLKKHFKANKDFHTENVADFWAVVSQEYKDTLQTVGSRYSDNIEKSQGLLVPWFFPADYVLDSPDEGTLFRNRVRKREIKPTYGFPTAATFSVLQPAIKKYLETLGVDVRLSITVDFTRDSIRYFSSAAGSVVNHEQADAVYYCASSALILKSVEPKIYQALSSEKRYLANALLQCNNNKEMPFFSEILCCDLQFPQLARLSQPNKEFSDVDCPGGLIQAELFMRTKDEFLQYGDLLQERIAEILKPLSNCTLKLRGIKTTRQVYSPNQQDLAQADAFMLNWSRQFRNFHNRALYGPINMAKALMWAVEDAAAI